MSIFSFDTQQDTITPQLVINKDQLLANTLKAIKAAGGAERLWPHVKTHKSAAVTRILINSGITKFKCATVAEAEMVCECGASKALVAYPAVGPAIKRILDLQQAYPEVEVLALFDDEGQLEEMSRQSRARGVTQHVMLDVDTGLGRTGIPFSNLASFYQNAAKLENVKIMGLHCYDGQRHESDAAVRKAETEKTYHAAKAIIDELNADGLEVPYLIMGGTPGFPCYIEHKDVFLSPGTLFLNDHGYAESYPDLVYPPAAAVLTRVISTPVSGQFTLDLGYKGIASDPAGQRGVLVDFPDAVPLFQNEEHWVWKMKEGHEAECPKVGDEFFVIPTHICPTSALYPFTIAVSKGKAVARWEVTSRNRKITY